MLLHLLHRGPELAPRLLANRILKFRFLGYNFFLKEYGEGNDKRLTGKHETCSINQFKYGVADRGAPRDERAVKDNHIFVDVNVEIHICSYPCKLSCIP